MTLIIRQGNNEQAIKEYVECENLELDQMLKVSDRESLVDSVADLAIKLARANRVLRAFEADEIEHTQIKILINRIEKVRDFLLPNVYQEKLIAQKNIFIEDESGFCLVL